MFMYVFPIVLVVLSNILYHICAKSIPENVNPMASLIITYLTAAALTTIAFLFYKTDKAFLQSFKELNWTSYVLGVAIVGLEIGYIMAYRVGWNISIGSLIANIIVALVLIPIGILFFKDGFNLNKILGVAFCIIGLIIINKK